MQPPITSAPHKERSLRQWRNRQIATWSCFALLYAGPCYILARAAGFESYVASVAMFFGIVTYIVALSAVTSTWRWRQIENGTDFGLALHIGRGLRGIMAIFSALAWVFPDSVLAFAYAVDFASGNFAIGACESFRNPIDDGGFLDTYLVTLLTGFFILFSLALLTLATFVVIKLLLATWSRIQIASAINGRSAGAP
ncbi:MAG: hypothetical protein AAF585_08830 [Verrucomicrobiota bacterium]